MAIRNIRISTDEFLRKKSKPVKEITDNVKTLLDDMAQTMYDANGVGLAAPQIGVLKRIVVIDIDGELIELINPEIIEKVGVQINNEGCLSVPGMTGQVERPEYVKVKALNRNGEEVVYEAENMKAVCFCHEIDHLDGILYIDKVIEGTFKEIETDDDEE